MIWRLEAVIVTGMEKKIEQDGGGGCWGLMSRVIL